MPRRIASALLTWAILLLVPAAVVIALVAGPLTTLLIPAARGCGHAATLALSARMLVAFAPQIPLYGLAVVLYGIPPVAPPFHRPGARAHLVQRPGGGRVHRLRGPRTRLPEPARRAPVQRGTDPGAGHHRGSGGSRPNRGHSGGAAPARAAARAALPGRRCAARARAGRGGRDHAHRPGPIDDRGDRAGQRPRRERRARPVQLRLAGLLHRLRGPRGSRGHQRVPDPVRAGQ